MEVSSSAFYAWAKPTFVLIINFIKNNYKLRRFNYFKIIKKIYGSRRLSESFIDEDI